MTSTTKNKILVLYTGGTIGCKRSDPDNPDSPLDVASWDEFSAGCKFLELEKKFYGIDAHEYDPPLDSTNMQPKDWQSMVSVIQERYDDYDGFVILHGTDTMIYTASALSFMIENLGKPIVITGSQLPILGHPRNDGQQNFITAMRIAAQYDGIPVIPEVCIFFRDYLYRGNRCVKVDAKGFGAFDSPSYPPLAEAGDSIAVNQEVIAPVPSRDIRPIFRKRLNTNIIPLPLFPGIQDEDSQVLPSLFKLGADAVILHGYGTGNAPTNGHFLETIRETKRNQEALHILDVSQCVVGKVNLGNYETSAKLLELGVLSGSDITREAALCKMMVLLGDEDRRPSDIEELAQRSLAGEQSESIYSTRLDDSKGQLVCDQDQLDPIMRIPGRTDIPANWSSDRVQSAFLRLRGVEFTSPKLDKDGKTSKAFNMRFALHFDVSADELDSPSPDSIVGEPTIRSSDHLGSILLFDILELVTTGRIKPGGRGVPFAIKLHDGHPGLQIQWDAAELTLLERSV
ncbi:MAG: asparaginase [Pseudomonadota bacterium]